MRSQPFLLWLSQNYNPGDASNIARNSDLRGGWEGWLQVEIAQAFIQNDARLCVREVPYPDGNDQFIGYNGKTATATGGVSDVRSAARADFYMQRRQGQTDATYIEVKTSSWGSGETVAGIMKDAWAKFYNDTLKVTAIQKINPPLNTFALLAYWGVLATEPWGVGNGNVAWFWQDSRVAYVWDTVPIGNLGAVPTLEQAVQVAQNQGEQQPRLIFVACALT